MAFELRYYQKEALSAVKAAYHNGQLNQMLVMATGVGKTVVFVHLKHELQLPGTVLILAHRDTLLNQAYDKWRSIYPDDRIGYEQASQHTDSDPYDVIVASKDSLRGPRLQRFIERHGSRISCIVVDEVHHSVGTSYQSIFEAFRCIPVDIETGLRGPDTSDIFLLGVTATPRRLDRRDLRATFPYVAYEYPVLKAMQDGFLCSAKAWQLSTKVDLTKISTVGGDYNQAELEKAIDTDIRHKLIIDKWKSIGGLERRSIVFCVTKDHARHSAEDYRKETENVWCVTEETPTEERTKIFEQFCWAPAPTVLVNISVASEGSDFPQADMIVLERPTKSMVCFQQMLGRGLRQFDGTDMTAEASRNPLTGLWDLPKKDHLVVLDVVDKVKSRSDLMTTPVLLGLPSNFMLEGRDVLEARNLMDKVLLHDPHLIAAVARMVDANEDVPTTFEGLKAALKRIMLFAPADVRGASVRYSKFNWIVTDERALVEDDCDAAEQYCLKIPAPQNASSVRRTGEYDQNGKPVIETVDIGERHFRLQFNHELDIWTVSILRPPLERVALDRERRTAIERATNENTAGYLKGQWFQRAKAAKAAMEAIPFNLDRTFSLYPDLERTIQHVDQHIERKHPTILSAIRTDSAWRTTRPSEHQLNFCKRNHIPITNKMRKGQVSDMIDNFHNMKDLIDSAE